jgi:hypothetical protein
VDGFKAYRYYLAVKLHFTTDKYNVFETRGNVRGTREAFTARNDRYIFEKLARKYDSDKEIIQFFVANFAYGNNEVIYSLADSENCYNEWMRRKQSISKIFVDDLAKMLTSIESSGVMAKCLFNYNDNEYPIAMKLFIGGKISIETLRIIDDIYPIIEAWKKNSSAMLIWENEFRRMTKLVGFVKYDKNKIVNIYNHFKEELEELQ